MAGYASSDYLLAVVEYHTIATLAERQQQRHDRLEQGIQSSPSGRQGVLERAIESMRQNLHSVQITTTEESKVNLTDAEDSALASVMRQRKSKSAGAGAGGSAGAMTRAKERREAKARLAKEKEEQARNQIEMEKQQEVQRRREMMAAAAERRLQGGSR